jgi:D-alanine-D-alanine ligase
MRKNIAIVAGGFSSEYTISINTSREIERSLDKAKYNTFLVVIDHDGWSATKGRHTAPINLDDFTCVLEGQKIEFDYALIAIHGTPGEDGKLQSYFDLIGLPYSGCSAGVSALTFNKFACKAFLAPYGVKMAEGILLQKNDPIPPDMAYPVFVKPNTSGSSFGISKVMAPDQLPGAIGSALDEGNEVLVEKFIEGVEISAAVADLNDQVQVFPLCEIVSKNEFFDFEAKYTVGKADEIVPARIPDADARNITELSERIYKRLQCSGLVRIDFILSGGIPYFLEINTVPGLSAESIVPKQIRATGRNLGEVLGSIIENGLNQPS